MSHKRRSIRPILALAVVGCMFALGGCATSLIPVESSAAPTPTASETVSDDAPTSLVPESLTFAAGDALTPGEWSAQWNDPFIGDDAFQIGVADDGQGNWSYIDAQTQCEIAFSQFSISELDRTLGDAQLSDELLGTIVGGTAAEVEPYAIDETLPQAFDRSATVDVRTIAGENPDSAQSWIVSARAFSALDAGLVVRIVCPAGGDAVAERDLLRDDYLHILVGPRF